MILMNSINHEGKGSPKHSIYNNSECDNLSHTSKEFDEVIVNYEAELVVALEEIDDLRKMIKKKMKKIVKKEKQHNYPCQDN